MLAIMSFLLLDSKNNVHRYGYFAVWCNVREQKVNIGGSVQALNLPGPWFPFFSLPTLVVGRAS